MEICFPALTSVLAKSPLNFRLGYCQGTRCFFVFDKYISKKIKNKKKSIFF